jgi:mono/diheme cytochrome c family protein
VPCDFGRSRDQLSQNWPDLYEPKEGPQLPAEEVVQLFHGEAANGTCTGCHGSDASGSALGADLTQGPWLWSDGSLDGITRTITQGVSQPKHSTGAMPPFGGSPLNSDEAKAVAAYVYAISRQKTH